MVSISVAGFRLVTMIYLETLKEYIKILKFQQDIGVTDACMGRIIKATKGCGQLSSNDTFFADIWFRIVKALLEENTEGEYYYGPLKTSYKGFFLATLGKLLKEFLEGSHIVMKSDTIVPGDKPSMAIGYN